MAGTGTGVAVYVEAGVPVWQAVKSNPNKTNTAILFISPPNLAGLL
jgi:hypothetical protein